MAVWRCELDRLRPRRSRRPFGWRDPILRVAAGILRATREARTFDATIRVCTTGVQHVPTNDETLENPGSRGGGAVAEDERSPKRARPPAGRRQQYTFVSMSRDLPLVGVLSVESLLVAAGRDRRPGPPLNVPPIPASNFVLGTERALLAR
jgi:hypothetical protein